MTQEEKLFDLIGMLPDDLTAQTEIPNPKRKSSPTARKRWIGIAVAASFVIAFVGWGMTSIPYYARDDANFSDHSIGRPDQNIGDPDSVPTQSGDDIVVDDLIDPTVDDGRIELNWPISGGAMNEAAVILSFLPLNGRMAEYQRVDPNSIPEAFRPSSLGSPYGESAPEGWYLPAEAAGLRYLVHQEGDGSYTLWEFACFTVWDQEELEQVAWNMEHEPDFLWADVEWFSLENMNFDPYAYGEVLETIYGVTSAEDLTQVAVSAANMDNTDAGKKLQKQIGTRTVWQREELDDLYGALVSMVCYGGDRWEQIDLGDSDSEDGILNSVRLCRYLTLQLADGSTIDTLKYSAAGGQFYEYGGIAYAPLNADTAVRMNEIFGIKTE